MQDLKDKSSIILDSIADGVFTVDKNWTISFFNRAAEKITGIGREQAIGEKCFDVFRANICQTVCALRESMRTGKEIVNFRVNILNSKGITVPISISTSVLKNEEGKIVGGVETFRDMSAIETLRKEISRQYTFEDIISKNHEIRKILDIIPDVALSGSTVLIEGPSGSGKELFAKAIHNLSKRKGKFIAVNCAALPDTLLESELFGYEKGAFSEAKKDKPGRFKLAENGTLLLDEIGDISQALQLKLLRVLQEKEYEPLGATNTVKADVRIIATTNRFLSELVEKGSFREDLFYRLNVFRIVLPNLSQRKEDIPLLLEHLLHKYNAIRGKEIERVSKEAINILMKYNFPGNIRELENFIEYAFVLCHGNEIDVRHLPGTLIGDTAKEVKKEELSDANPLDEAEITTIMEALCKYDGNRIKAADYLGINKSTLWRKMKKYSITYKTTGGTDNS